MAAQVRGQEAGVRVALRGLPFQTVSHEVGEGRTDLRVPLPQGAADVERTDRHTRQQLEQDDAQAVDVCAAVHGLGNGEILANGLEGAACCSGAM